MARVWIVSAAYASFVSRQGCFTLNLYIHVQSHESTMDCAQFLSEYSKADEFAEPTSTPQLKSMGLQVVRQAQFCIKPSTSLCHQGRTCSDWATLPLPSSGKEQTLSSDGQCPQCCGKGPLKPDEGKLRAACSTGRRKHTMNNQLSV